MKSTQVVMINFIKKKNTKKNKKLQQNTNWRTIGWVFWKANTTRKRRHGVDYNIKQHTGYIVIVCCNIMLNICSNKLEKKRYNGPLESKQYSYIQLMENSIMILV